MCFSIGNNISGEIPATTCSCRGVEVLHLSRNKLTGLMPDCIFDLPERREINLGKNQLQGRIPNNFSGNNKVRILDLSENELVGQLPASLLSCNSLEFLDLGSNKLSGTFPLWLRDLPLLRVLVLRSNSFSGTINFSISVEAFPRIQMLDISNNYFDGTLPWGLFQSFNLKETTSKFKVIGTIPAIVFRDFLAQKGEWEASMNVKGIELEYTERMEAIVATIDLSGNSFSGEIPKEIGEIRVLQSLNISYNNITGPISKGTGTLHQLESLDLSHNHLSGEIPVELAGLDSLGFIDLAYNNLSGRIPQPPHFSTFASASFEGNPGLCGPPLSKLCEANGSATTTVREPLDEDLVKKYISVGLGFGVGFGTTVSFCYFWMRNGKGYGCLGRRFF